MSETLTLAFAKNGGLLPVIAQDWQTLEILMQAFVNQEALEKSLRSGKAHYFSRSKGRLWMKGETSGHVQEIKEVLVDCDLDSLVFKVQQIGGAACHTGYNSCYYRKLDEDLQAEIIKSEKVFNPAEVYAEAKRV